MLTVAPTNSTQPSPLLTIFSTLTCEIQADFPLSTTTVESRWTLPNGTIIGANDDSGRYSVVQGSNGGGGYLIMLLIRPTIYSDANTYTCGVRDIRNPDSHGRWLSSQATLRLLGKHLSMDCNLLWSCIIYS